MASREEMLRLLDRAEQIVKESQVLAASGQSSVVAEQLPEALLAIRKLCSLIKAEG
jgi:hypothetical protein